MIWLDAFSDCYLSPELCPFLWNLSKECFFAKISPLFTYIGIKECFETGVSINTHKVWSDHIFRGFHNSNRESKRLRFFKKFVGFVDKISFSDDWNKALRYALFKAFKVDYGTPHLIPASLLDLFPAPEKCYKGKNLYEILREHNIKFIKREPKLNIEEGLVLKSIPKLLKHYDVLFIKLNSLDSLGHKYGPLSDVVKWRVRWFDEALTSLIKALDKDVVLILMSDHGMVPIFSSHDLLGFLKDKGYQYGHDYVAFVGATYTSLWFDNEEIKRAIEEDLQTLKFGSLLTFDDKVKLGLKNIGPEYGETIFVNNEHSVSFPEFYHQRKPPAGMHGYAFSNYDSSFFLLHSDLESARTICNIDFVDIMPTILRLYNLSVPSYVEGHSVL